MKLLKDLRNIFNDEPIIISLVFISLITSVFLLFCKFGDIVTFFERVFAALQHLLISNTAVGIVVLLSLVLFCNIFGQVSGIRLMPFPLCEFRRCRTRSPFPVSA